MPRVLIVEDNEMNRDMLTRRLLRKGFDVVHAANGREGIEAAAREHPDVILMDLSLPEIDGLEAARQLKAHEDTRGIPIIALTAHAMANDRLRAFEAGCDEYETKPVDLDRLLGKLHAVLGVHL
jgi:CheY-like chemotaxis protein